MTEQDILNAMCDRKIVKAYWEDPSESKLILELHDGLRVVVKSDRDWDCGKGEPYIELGLLSERS